jgi:hypothetical protein
MARRPLIAVLAGAGKREELRCLRFRPPVTPPTARGSAGFLLVRESLVAPFAALAEEPSAESRVHRRLPFGRAEPGAERRSTTQEPTAEPHGGVHNPEATCQKMTRRLRPPPRPTHGGRPLRTQRPARTDASPPTICQRPQPDYCAGWSFVTLIWPPTGRPGESVPTSSSTDELWEFRGNRTCGTVVADGNGSIRRTSSNLPGLVRVATYRVIQRTGSVSGHGHDDIHPTATSNSTPRQRITDVTFVENALPNDETNCTPAAVKSGYPKTLNKQRRL